ncbi:MAG: hydroxymethylbilane synthase [Planctomycetes bacterium]|nr:hydroxymethylbilane synthase [Planctomycetota bacterium]MCG2682989.1 hydroxymethylbilane synthase [Planctomycetales bacterium]
MPLRIGARASALAQWQAEWVAARLRQRGTEVELVPIATAGDRQSGAVGAIGRQGVFTKEIQHALLEGRIDLAVHSLKDLPTAAIEGLTLAAVPERGPPGDVLVSADGARLDELPRGARIGTGSPRRRAQLLHFRGDLIIKDVRGNVETRLRKLRQGDFDALVLAEAGLHRLGLAEQITQKLPVDIMLPAPGQGALGLETRTEDAPTRRLVAALDHPDTHAAVSAERTMLLALQGGCLAPIAALGRVEDGLLTLAGRVLGRDGARMLESADSASPAEAEELGRRVAEALSAQGAAELIRAAREFA